MDYANMGTQSYCVQIVIPYWSIPLRIQIASFAMIELLPAVGIALNVNPVLVRRSGVVEGSSSSSSSSSRPRRGASVVLAGVECAPYSPGAPRPVSRLGLNG